jgi:7-keto-8-aminopelargonate synthetase-like enzyme
MVLVYIFVVKSYIPTLYRQTHSISLLQEIARKELDMIKDAGMWKTEHVITSKQGSQITAEGHEHHKILNLCSNNYLGLAVSTAQTTNC